MTPEKRNEWLFSNIDEDEAAILLYDWEFWARDEQLVPRERFKAWILRCGRGWGKTRTGAETTITWKNQGYSRMALIGMTPADVRDVMIKGESGIIACSPPWDKPEYVLNTKTLTWPNGYFAKAYSGANPEELRGPQHTKGWIDELCAFAYPSETLDMFLMGLRLGDNPQYVVTTTPKPDKLLRKLEGSKGTITIVRPTFDNEDNLPTSFIDGLKEEYVGTRLGEQELYAKILDDNPNALWKRDLIDIDRLTIHTTGKLAGKLMGLPGLAKVIISVDPAVTSKAESDEVGIVVQGLGDNGHGYQIEDISCKKEGNNWAKKIIEAFKTEYYGYKPSYVLYETNQGGELVKDVINLLDSSVVCKGVHSKENKLTRAEPIHALAEKHKIHHVKRFEKLEDELCEWEPGKKSPNRMDAYVQGFRDLLIGHKDVRSVVITETHKSAWHDMYDSDYE